MYICKERACMMYACSVHMLGAWLDQAYTKKSVCVVLAPEPCKL